MKGKLIFAAVIVFAWSATGIGMAQSAGDLYKSKCAMCHGADGKGKTPMGPKIGVRDLTSGPAAKETDAEWITITKKGKNKMPAYDGKLTDDQIKELVKHCRSLK